LRQRLIQMELLGADSRNQFTDILNTIKKHSKILDEENLIKDLQTILNAPVESTHLNPKRSVDTLQKDLDRLLTSETIQQVDEADDWQTALELAAQPLLKNGSIDQGYIEAIKEDFPQVKDYIVLRNNIAIPHAEIERGSNKLGDELVAYPTRHHKLGWQQT